MSANRVPGIRYPYRMFGRVFLVYVSRNCMKVEFFYVCQVRLRSVCWALLANKQS